MREEIEAAALFITKLVNKNLSQSNSVACSSASSTHSSASSTSSDSPPGFEDQSSSPASSPTTTNTSSTLNNNGDSLTTSSQTEPNDKVEQFRQCLTKALYERFHNHWFPEQPSKGQAYRCIRLNEWDRHDITLRRVCLECGIDYKDLQLPVELTLWVDPEEVTCRFGENKGSHCLVAKFKDGELRDNNLMNIDDINNIDIEYFSKQQQQDNNNHHHHHQNNNDHQTPTIDRMRHLSLHNSPDYGKQNSNMHHHQQQHNQHNNNSLTNGHVVMNNNNNSSYHSYIQQHQAHHHQTSPQQHHHRSNLGKAAIHHSYHPSNAGNMNPIYYYF